MIKQHLPKDYRKSKAIKNSFDKEENNIVAGIRMESSDFGEQEDMFVLIFDVRIHDIFWVFDGPKSALSLIEGSLQSNEICPLVDWRDLDHFDEFDELIISKKIQEIIVPFLEDFCKPKNVIEFLEVLEDLDQLDDPQLEDHKYARILRSKIDEPSRTRKYFNGAIASIYYALGDKKNTMKYLEKHLDFVRSDHKKTNIKSINDAYNKTVDFLENSMRGLQN